VLNPWGVSTERVGDSQAAASPLEDVSAVPECHDDDKEDVIGDGVDDPVITHPNA